MNSAHGSFPGRGLRRRRLLVAGALTVALAGVAVTSGVGQAADQESAPSASASRGPLAAPALRAQTPAGPTRQVTLISGDVVTVRTGAGAAVLRTTPGPGRTAMTFLRYQRGDQQYVVPADAVRPLARGLLDHRLFDVHRLLADGRDDRSAKATPVIVRYAAGAQAQRTRAAVSRAHTGAVRDLPALNLTAMAIRKSATASFWSRVVAPGAGGVRKVWLDGIARPTLDESVAQIGAPAAWRAGFTGRGVKVAILDSGVDAAHPDLAARVSASADFTGGDGTAADTDGHGTHVAGTVGGSGAASGGKYRGVAPDADLIAGRVCTEYDCPESSILAGMQWAVKQDARIVNMSLGGPDAPGIDPLEEGVNKLSADHGTLFVVAAGNDGPSPSVGSPASAAAALAVGAVDGKDRMAEFSSRGPRTGDGGIKPDVTAPGVGIVAARARGKLDDKAVDDSYAALDGTSMATPHVAGAAALLAQRHPEWKGDRLKAALISTTTPIEAAVFDTGAGRIDVARATTQTVTADGDLSFGTQLWPHGDDEVLTRNVTYRNDGPQPVTLALDLTVSSPGAAAVPESMFTVPSSVTVPAGESRTVPVAVDTRGPAADGTYTAILTGTTADGAVRVRTPLAVEREQESYELTVKLTDRAGNPTDSDVSLARAGSEGKQADLPFLSVSGGTGRIRLPKGGWDLITGIAEPTTDPDVAPDVTLVHAGVNLDRARTVELSSRGGKPVKVTVPDKTARLGVVYVDLAIGPERHPSSIFLIGQAGPTRKQITRINAVPSTGPAAGNLLFAVNTKWARPNGDGFADSPYRYDAYLPSPGAIPRQLSYKLTAKKFAAVTERFPTGDGTHTQVESVPGYGDGGSGGAVGDFPVSGGQQVVYYTAAPRAYWHTVTTHGTADGVIVGQVGPAAERFRPGYHRTRDWSRAIVGPAFRPGEDGTLGHRSEREMRLRLPLLSDSVATHVGYATGRADGEVQLFRDGKLTGTAHPADRASLPVPSEAAEYKLTARVKTGAALGGFSSDVSATWTFRSAAPPAAPPAGGPQVVPLPLAAIRYRLRADDMAGAPAGRMRLPMTVSAMVAPAPAVTSLTTEVSFDDGRSWTAATVNRTASGWEAQYEQPAAAGTWVSLRSTLATADGATTTQTIVHAYKLR